MIKNIILLFFIGSSILSCREDLKTADLFSCSHPTQKEIKEFIEFFISENVKPSNIIISTPIENINNFNNLFDNYVLDNLNINEETIDTIDIICMKEQSKNNLELKFNTFTLDSAYTFMDINKLKVDYSNLNEIYFISLPYFNRAKDIVYIGIEIDYITQEQSSGFILTYKKEKDGWKRINILQHVMS